MVPSTANLAPISGSSSSEIAVPVTSSKSFWWMDQKRTATNNFDGSSILLLPLLLCCHHDDPLQPLPPLVSILWLILPPPLPLLRRYTSTDPKPPEAITSSVHPVHDTGARIVGVAAPAPGPNQESSRSEPEPQESSDIFPPFPWRLPELVLRMSASFLPKIGLGGSLGKS